MIFIKQAEFELSARVAVGRAFRSFNLRRPGTESRNDETSGDIGNHGCEHALLYFLVRLDLLPGRSFILRTAMEL